jgi:hypothetical protein
LMLMNPYSKGAIVETMEDIHRVVDQLCADIDKHFRAIDDLQETRSMFEAELPKAEFPEPSRRTPRQEQVARCPRCRGELYEPPRAP